MEERVVCTGCPLLVILTVLALVTGCDLRAPIKVGFSGQLTGPNANMGVSGRDGALLAIEEINTAGGIAGRKVELVVADDKGDPEGARAADRELIDGGVVAIIGHMTSGQTMAALPVVEEADMVLLAPTTSTPALTGKVDHFFRVIADSVEEARMHARHAVDGIELERMAVIYDQDNSAFTSAYLHAFADELRKLGGRIVVEAGYSSAENPLFGPLVSQLCSSDPQGLLIIASAYDAALIAQQARLLGWEPHFFASGWSRSARLIENGGRAVEGMRFIHYFDPNSTTDNYLKFKQKYQERFKQAPTFMAGNAYEAMLVLAAALEKTGGRAKGLTQTLPGMSINGLMESLSLDQYGDGVRVRYHIVVQDGKFVTKGKVSQ